MIRLAILAVLLASVFGANAANVIFTHVNLTNYPSRSMVVKLTPTNAPGLSSSGIVLRDPLKFSTDTNGALTVSNLAPIDIIVEATGPYAVTPYRITVPDSTDTFYATNLLSVGIATNGTASAYSIPASNARFLTKSNSGTTGYVATLTNGQWTALPPASSGQPASANLTNWSGLATSAVTRTANNGSDFADPWITLINLRGAPVLSPAMFGAVGNGVADDSAAMTAMFNALNSSTNRSMVIDLLGLTNKFSSGVSVSSSRPDVKIQNGTLLWNSTNGTALQVFNSTVYNNFVIENVKLFQVAGIPNTNCVGIWLGDSVTAYGINSTVFNCVVSNFWRGVTIQAMTQTRILNNVLINNWSNHIYLAPGVGGNPDMSEVGFNTLINNTAPSGPNKTNVVAIQSDSNCLGFSQHDNNGVGCSRAVWWTTNCSFAIVHIAHDEWENFYNNGVNTNYCPFEFNNCLVDMKNVNNIAGVTASYLGWIGLYWGSAHSQLGLCQFHQLTTLQTVPAMFDFYASTNFDNVWFPPADFPTTVTVHRTSGDAGQLYSFSRAQGTAPFQHESTNILKVTTSAMGAGSQIRIQGGGGGGITVDNNGDAVSFTTAGSVSFGDFATASISDRGAQPGLVFNAANTHQFTFNSGNMTIQSNLTVSGGGGVTTKYLAFSGSAPTASTNGGTALGGNGASITVDANSNDSRGSATIVTAASGVAASVKAGTITFSATKPAADFMAVPVPLNPLTAGGVGSPHFFFTNYTTSSMEIWSGSTAPGAATTFKIGWVCIQ